MTNKEAPYKAEPNPVIVQLKRELAEARENELESRRLGSSQVLRWVGFQEGLRRAIEIVEKGK